MMTFETLICAEMTELESEEETRQELNLHFITHLIITIEIIAIGTKTCAFLFFLIENISDSTSRTILFRWA